MPTQLSLAGTWDLRQAESTTVPLPATVPGTVHGALLAAGKIPDPYWRDNEREVQWVGETAWTFTRSFDVPADMLKEDRLELVFEGLDTFAEVVLNGSSLGQTDNMHRVWRFDVKNLLHAGSNTLDLHFHPTQPYIDARNTERHLPEWKGALETAGRAWVRKQASSYGWDWGPVLTSQGPYRSVYLDAWSGPRLRSAHVQQRHTAGRVTLTVTPEVEMPSDGFAARVRVSRDGKQVAESQGDNEIVLEIRDPKLWWPNGTGAQPLYRIDVELIDEVGTVCDTWTRKIGLRTFRLVTEPDVWGQSFYFEVNRQAFFAKGANWIPADGILDRITPARYRDLLGSAVEAHMNVIRVWGGGVYEDDRFYELCDELGLCVWQDFMFACSAYPGDEPAFVESVRAEAEVHIRRLRHHASLMLWCGNNEIEQGLVGEGWTPFHMSWAAYDPIFNEALPELVQQLDPGRDYWPASPHNPLDRSTHNDPRAGDAHLWDVWHGKKPFEWYLTSQHRFCSEFGFQSFPEPSSLEQFTLSQDRQFDSRVMDLHQRSPVGNGLILDYMRRYFRVPAAFEDQVWLSQILQATAIETAVSHWRRNQPRSMGALYWQLNDCWPAASWSSIDYYGRWKAMHHRAQHFFAPRLISLVFDEKRSLVEVHATNDGAWVAGSLNVVLTTAAGEVLSQQVYDAELPARSSRIIEQLDLTQPVGSWGVSDLVAWVRFDAVDGETAEAMLPLASFNRLALPAPELDITDDQTDEQGRRLTVRARHNAFWVWVDSGVSPIDVEGQFRHIRAGETHTFTIRRQAGRAEVTIRSLYDLMPPAPSSGPPVRWLAAGGLLAGLAMAYALRSKP
ncbi:MAG: hypothetical protein AAGI08_06775 [Bacteroidota bacterium]